MSRIAAALVGLAFLVAPGAFASETLTADQVGRFLATVDEVEAFGAELEAAGKTDALAVDMQPTGGEPFKPYENGVAAMKAHYPEEHARLGGIVSKHGFSTDSWARVGDRVMIAYFAEMVAQEDPASIAESRRMMEAMDPQTLQMMPPEVRAQIDAGLAMMRMVDEAPEADRAAVRPHIATLNSAFNGGQ